MRLTHLQDEMARGGYRTLVIAQKELTPAQYSEWNAEFEAASVALVDRENKVSTTGSGYIRVILPGCEILYMKPCVGVLT